MTKKSDIYVMIYFLDLHRACCLDRGYCVLPEDAPWGEVCAQDFVQIENNVIYDQCPQWVHTALKDGHRCVTFWTNYFD